MLPHTFVASVLVELLLIESYRY